MIRSCRGTTVYLVTFGPICEEEAAHHQGNDPQNRRHLKQNSKTSEKNNETNLNSFHFKLSPQMLLKATVTVPNGQSVPINSSSDDLSEAMPLRPLRLRQQQNQTNNNGSLPYVLFKIRFLIIRKPFLFCFIFVRRRLTYLFIITYNRYLR